MDIYNHNLQKKYILTNFQIVPNELFENGKMYQLEIRKVLKLFRYFSRSWRAKENGNGDKRKLGSTLSCNHYSIFTVSYTEVLSIFFAIYSNY